MPGYSYTLQYAQHDVDQVDDKGAASPADILAAFDAFDWPGQARAAAELQKCSPTFSVLEEGGKRFFWVSVCDDAGLKFVNDYSGGSSGRELSLAEARRGVELFLQGDNRGLLALLK